jgi:hypothetical protein
MEHRGTALEACATKVLVQIGRNDVQDEVWVCGGRLVGFFLADPRRNDDWRERGARTRRIDGFRNRPGGNRSD